MREVAGKLLHFADGFGQFFFFHHAVVSGHDLISIMLGGLPVGAGGEVLGKLAEDPGVGGGGAADHDGVATGVAAHAHGVFGGDDVTITDNRNFYRLFNVGDAGPIGASGVALFARPRMEGDGGDADVLRHAGDFDVDQFAVIPAGAELHGQRNLYRISTLFKN